MAVIYSICTCTCTAVAPNRVHVTILEANVDNDGYIPLDLIDSDSGKIMCHTNHTDCCNSEDMMRQPLGDWYFPDGSIVSGKNENLIRDATPYFVRNRGNHVIRLFRNNDTTMSSPPRAQRGRFRCVVPNDQDINQTYYVNICKLLSSPPPPPPPPP